MINLWLALREEAVAELNDWAASDSLTDEQRMVMDAILSHPDTQHIEQAHKKDTNGGKVWTLYSMYTSGSSIVLGNLTDWLSAYNGKAYVIGAWEMDGRQWGTQIDYEGAITGEPLYPMQARSKKFMPDDVTYDNDGNETSRSNSTKNKQVNLLAGQSPRKFT